MDIFLTFRTTYIKSSTGDEIFDSRQIVIHYLKTRFFVDFLSTFPFRLLINNESLTFLNLFGILKVARVLRLGRIINSLNAKDELKMTLKLCNLVFYLVLYIHLAGCTWHYVHNGPKNWVPPLDYMFVMTDLYDRDLYYQYSIAFYHAILMLNGNEVGPRDTSQYIFVSTSLVVGAMLNANIFGNMAVLLQEINKKASKFQEKIDLANTAMMNMGLPMVMQNKVINYLLYTQSNLDRQHDFNELQMMVSPSLRMDIIRNIFSKIIGQNSIFGGSNDDLVDTVLLSISTDSFPPEASIIKQNDEADNLYFLSEGELEVMVNDENNKVHRIDILTKGAMFGEIALISN